uniref:Chromosome 19 open reading frame 18 n=1 Tax=Loxodonta africana TaxID=9785 RepID=G3T3Z2_LOXAF
MDKFQSSFTFLFLFLMECPLHLCLPHAGEFKSTGKIIRLKGNKLSQTSRNGTNHPNVFSLHGTQVPLTKIKSSGHTGKNSNDAFQIIRRLALIPHRPALVRVIVAACIAISIALLGGIAVFCIMYRLVQAEERQQLALLYKNVKIPLLGDEEEGSEDEGQDESTYLLPENEKELEKFIHSVIKSKRRKIIEKKRLSEKQKLAKERKIQSATHHAKMEHL